MSDPGSHRRDFLTGKAFHREVRQVGDVIADSLIGHTKTAAPPSGDTLQMTVRAMACDFSVILNGGEHDRVWDATDALDLFHSLEQQLTVYRDDSEVSRLNATAHDQPVVAEAQLFELLTVAKTLFKQTGGTFDLTTDPLIRLWRRCREEVRAPAQTEIDEVLSTVGMQHVMLDAENCTVEFEKHGMSINLGAIGKGYALDRAAELLGERGVEDMLLHGGHSSLLTRGEHHECGGWPVGIGNPLFTDQRLGTIVLKDQAMATSGSNIQYFRVAGQRFGHILDPRTGWPVAGTLGVTAIASSAAMADALSTAFYVMGEQATEEFCAAHPEVGAIVIPQPRADRRVSPRIFNVDPQQIYWDPEQIVVGE